MHIEKGKPEFSALCVALTVMLGIMAVPTIAYALPGLGSLKRATGEELLELIGEALVSKPAFWFLMIVLAIGLFVYPIIIGQMIELTLEKKKMQKELEAIRSDLDAVLEAVTMSCQHCRRLCSPHDNYCKWCSGALRYATTPPPQPAVPVQPERSQGEGGEPRDALFKL